MTYYQAEAIREIEAQIASLVLKMNKTSADMIRRIETGKRAGIAQAGKELGELGGEIRALTLTRALLLECGENQ